jgi:hypothetical protein
MNSHIALALDAERRCDLREETARLRAGESARTPRLSIRARVARRRRRAPSRP